jgi:hypothetical protein
MYRTVEHGSMDRTVRIGKLGDKSAEKAAETGQVR